eukprot:437024_1
MIEFTNIDTFNKIHESTADNDSENKTKSCPYICVENHYNILRIIMLLMTLISFFITLLYGVGQILTLKLDDYFCEPKTLSEIHQHSSQNNLNEGDLGSCWTTNHYQSDQHKTYFAGYMAGYKAVLDRSDINVFYCIVFFSISLYLIIIFIYFLSHFIIDCCSQKVFISHGKPTEIHIWLSWYRKKFSVDAKYWVLKTVLQQLLKLIIESIAFVQYGGAQSNILYVFHSQNKIIPSENPQYIILFSIFLGLNFIFAAVIWFCYLYKFNTCHGRFFFGLLFLF